MVGSSDVSSLQRWWEGSVNERGQRTLSRHYSALGTSGKEQVEFLVCTGLALSGAIFIVFATTSNVEAILAFLRNPNTNEEE